MVRRMRYTSSNDPSNPASNRLDSTTWKMSPSRIYRLACSTMEQNCSRLNRASTGVVSRAGRWGAGAPWRRSSAIRSSWAQAAG